MGVAVSKQCLPKILFILELNLTYIVLDYNRDLKYSLLRFKVNL